MPLGIHIHIDSPEFEAAKYAFEVLLADADAPMSFHRSAPRALAEGSLLITYSPRPVQPSHPKQLILRANRSLWEHYGTDASLPAAPLNRVGLGELRASLGPELQEPMFFPFRSEDHEPSVDYRAPDGEGRTWLVTGSDPIASAFFWITRYEDGLIRQRDEFGRIPQERFCAVREGVAGRPLVDEYSALLRTWFDMLGAGVAFRRPPFRALLTHDVDSGVSVGGLAKHAENGLRTLYREAVRGGRLWTGLVGFGEWALRGLGVRDEASQFRDIVLLDAEFGFRSLFFLMSNGTHRHDAKYDILGGAAREAIRTIRDRGGDIGLHVGINAHQNQEQFRGEWERLRQADASAWPVARSHFLSFFPPRTWRQLCDLGFVADSTVGFSDQMGFGSGTCRPFVPFDVERREILPIWELPMTLMDNNLFRRPSWGDADRLSAVREIAARVRAHGGCLVINWHNVVFFGHYRKTYRSILEELRGALPFDLRELRVGDGRVLG